MTVTSQNSEIWDTLKLHISMGLNADSNEDNRLDIRVRIAEIDSEFAKMLSAVSTDTVDMFDEARATALMFEKNQLQKQLNEYLEQNKERESAQSRVNDIFSVLKEIRNQPLEYDDKLVRKLLECVVVENKERVKVVFKGGVEVEEELL